MTYRSKYSISDSDELITYVFPDFNAVKYCEKDFIANEEFYFVEEESANGFEIYLIEQWVLNRKIGSVISTYTGNPGSKIAVIKLTIVKKDLKEYPARFQEYLNELVLNNAKAIKLDNNAHLREFIYVTNSAVLPSNLNLVPIHRGDVRLVEVDFVVNSNLKRLHCSGRTSTLLSLKITDVSEDRFRQMYKIYDDKVPIRFAVRELVNIIQISLFYFDLLDIKYCDGLLCSKTEESIADWWNIIGLSHYSFKPNLKSEVFSNVTVAAIISLVLSTRLRLQLIGGCDVPKDVYDFENFMISIGQFQKQHKLEKKRRLDVQTLSKIFAITSSKIGSYEISEELYPELSYYNSPYGANGAMSAFRYGKEIKKLTNAVKTTVQDKLIAPTKDIEGLNNSKSSSGRIRNRIAKLAENVNPPDIETLDLELLVNNYLSGKTLLRLWHGSGESSTSGSGAADKGNRNSMLRHKSRLQTQHHHTHHHRLRHHHHASLRSEGPENQLFQFLSFKDLVSNTQDMMIARPNNGSITDLSRYSKSFNKVKLGLQNKKVLNISDRPKKATSDEFYSGETSTDNLNDNNESLKPPIGYDSTADFDEVHKEFATGIARNYYPLFSENLNRRHSFPFMKNGTELNLNLIDISRTDPIFNSPTENLRRHGSFSTIEDYVLEKPSSSPLLCSRELANMYLKNLKLLIPMSSHRADINEKYLVTKYSPQDIQKLYQRLNHELVTFNHTYHRMIMKKNSLLHGDLVENLEYSISDLSATVDRLVYEIRIVAKRLYELEEDYSVFETKLKDKTMIRLSKVINDLVILPKFIQAYNDEEERKKVIFKLTGKNPEDLDLGISEIYTKNTTWKLIILYAYDFILFLLLFFKIDKSRINLYRIKNSWKKLDPNRTYIDKVYSIIGKDTDNSESSL